MAPSRGAAARCRLPPTAPGRPVSRPYGRAATRRPRRRNDLAVRRRPGSSP